MMPRNDIFDSTTRPGKSLLYSRNDPVDRKMGEFVGTDTKDYDSSDIVIAGSPHDFGVRRNQGRAGARKAPEEIRRALYKFPVPPGATERKIFDLGDIKVQRTLEDTHELHYAVVKRVLDDGKKIVMLGGGNDISYPDCRALAEDSDNLAVFNIDSHYDVRESDTPHSGTPYRQLLDEKIIRPDNFYELAGKRIANSPAYHEFLEKLGVNIFSLQEMRREGSGALVRSILNGSSSDAIFWGYDIDAVRSTDAPGVSAPYPEGLSAEEINEIARISGADDRTRMIEITEVNPEYDIDGRTSKLAAMIIMNYLWEVFDEN